MKRLFSEDKRNFNLTQILLFLLVIAVGSYVFSLIWAVISQFTDILTIVLTSWLVSFLLDPIVDLIQKYLRQSKVVSAVITYVLLSVGIVAIGFVYIPMITTQIAVLVNLLPSFLNTLPSFLSNFINGPLITQFEGSLALIPSIAQFFFSAFMVLIFSFYFIVEQKKIDQEVSNLIPSGWHDTLEFIKKVINDTFISFIRVQFFYGVSIALITWLVMALFGTGFAISIAFLAGVFAIIPLVGPLLALVLPVMVAFLINPFSALLIGIILFVSQQIIFNIIGPKLLGKAFSLHPAIILVSLLVGLKFGGTQGAIFAIPILGIGVVMIRKFGLRFVEIINKQTL